MITLNKNYQKNIDILKENIRRGMVYSHASGIVNAMEQQFKSADLYQEQEKHFINEMRAVLINSFTHLTVKNN